MSYGTGDDWVLYDDAGNVDVTETVEEFEGAAQPDVAEEYQRQCVEGRIEWLDGGEPIETTQKRTRSSAA